MKLHSIQFLRGIAAILVVYTHSLQLQMEYSVSVQQNIFHLQNFGCIGVDLFFVVSGFIIMFVANKYSGANEGFYFLLKRFFRINPVYYIASLFFLVFLLIQNWITTGTPDVPFANILNSFSDTILIMPVSDHILSYKPIIVAGWTLGFEWLFYTIFFLLILIKVKNKLAWLIILIACLLTSGFLFNSSDYRFVFATNPIMLEFLLGAIIYWLHIRLKAVPFYIAFACLSTGIIGYLSLIVFGFGEVWSYIMVLTKRLSFERFLFWGVPSAFIVAGCLFLENNSVFSKIWKNKWMTLSGEASYSIYLINPIVFFWLSFLYKKVGVLTQPDVTVLIQMLIAILISIAFYKIIERPVIKVGEKIVSTIQTGMLQAKPIVPV